MKKLETYLSAGSSEKFNRVLNAGHGPTLRFALRAVTRIAVTALGLPITSTTGQNVYGQEELDGDMSWLELLYQEANDHVGKTKFEIPTVPDTEKNVPEGPSGGSEQLRDGVQPDGVQRVGGVDGGNSSDLDDSRHEPVEPGNRLRDGGSGGQRQEHPAAVPRRLNKPGFTRR